MNVQTDHEPLRVIKPAEQAVHYKQQVNVRFLEPPPPPEPAPIIIKVNNYPINMNEVYTEVCTFRNDKLQHHLHHLQ